MANLDEFFQNAKFISHLNLSGMNFEKDKIKELITSLEKCVYLSSVHLSDNNICVEREFYYEVLDEFNISEKDVIQINRSLIK